LGCKIATLRLSWTLSSRQGLSMDQRVINLYDRFTHGGINRREFLDRLAELTGSAAAAAAVVPLLQNDPAKAAIVAADDPRLATDTVDYDANGTKMSGYLARGKDRTKRPAVVVIHENRGLIPHIKDVARRLALEGFLAVSDDFDHVALVGQDGAETSGDRRFIVGDENFRISVLHTVPCTCCLARKTDGNH